VTNISRSGAIRTRLVTPGVESMASR